MLSSSVDNVLLFFCEAAGRIVKLDEAVDGDAYERSCRRGGDADAGMDMDSVNGILVAVVAVVAVSAVLLLSMLAVLNVDEKEAVVVGGLLPLPVWWLCRAWLVLRCGALHEFSGSPSSSSRMSSGGSSNGSMLSMPSCFSGGGGRRARVGGGPWGRM